MSTPGTAAISANVVDAGSRFHLQNHDAFAVPVAGIAGQSGFVHAALREIDRARADRGIVGATDGLARLLRSIDLGNENAIRSQVERLLDSGTVGVSPDTHKELRSAVGNATEHGGKFFVTHGTVLGVDQPGGSLVPKLLGDREAVWVKEQAHLGCSGAELFFEFSSAECGVGLG
jgi:hypothetical protein